MSRGVSFFENYLLSPIAPQTLDAAAASSAWLPVKGCTRVYAIVQVGDTDTTVDAKIEQGKTVSGTSAKDVTGAAITQVTASGDNKVYCIDLEVNHMDIMNDFDHVRLTVTGGNGTTGAVVSAVVLRYMESRPVTQPATVAEVVVVAG